MLIQTARIACKEFKNAYPAERIADRAAAMGITSYDEDKAGGRLVVVGRKVIYVCTDAHAVGNISTFVDHETALAAAREVTEYMVDACN